MLNSFSYMFKENGFLKKFFILFAFVLAANFLINLSGLFEQLLGKSSLWYNTTLIFGYIFMFVPYGYSIALLKTNMTEKENATLLDVDIFESFKKGFKVVISGLILVLSVFIILTLLVLVSKLLYTKFGVLGSSFMYTVIFLIFLIISFLMIGLCCRYVIKPSWLNFVNLKAVLALINNDVAKYFKVYAVTAVLLIILGVLSAISAYFLTEMGFTGFVLYNVIISLMWSYLTLVFAKLFSFAVDVDKI